MHSVFILNLWSNIQWSGSSKQIDSFCDRFTKDFTLETSYEPARNLLARHECLPAAAGWLLICQLWSLSQHLCWRIWRLKAILDPDHYRHDHQNHPGHPDNSDHPDQFNRSKLWFQGSFALLHCFLSFPCSLVTHCSHQVLGCGKDWFPISLLNFYFFFLSLLATDGLGLELKYSCSSFFKQFSTFQLAQGSPVLQWSIGKKIRTLNTLCSMITAKSKW